MNGERKKERKKEREVCCRSGSGDSFYVIIEDEGGPSRKYTHL